MRPITEPWDIGMGTRPPDRTTRRFMALFKDPAAAVVHKEIGGGVAVPDSNFVANLDLVSARSLVPVWQRIHGATTGGTPGGLHGTGLVSVKALPQGLQPVQHIRGRRPRVC